METPEHYDSSHAAAFQAGHKAGEEQGFWTGYNEACKDFKIGEWTPSSPTRGTLMAPKKITPKTLPLVWLKLTKYVAELQDAPEAATAFCLDLNSFLDDQASYDAFGTEGQCDPRGDQRN